MQAPVLDPVDPHSVPHSVREPDLDSASVLVGEAEEEQEQEEQLEQEVVEEREEQEQIVWEEQDEEARKD